MENKRVVMVFWLFFLLSLSAAGGRAFAQEGFPDFLGDDVNDKDYLNEAPPVEVSDPLEPMNRAFYHFNDKLYDWVLKPVTDGYIWAVPHDIRECLGNFFLNLAMPVRLLNSLLQGNLEKTGVVLERFVINTTLGVYGFADIANKQFDIEPRHADFGQTLGKWGLGAGIYFCWPVVGPSNVRDTVGLAADIYSHPVPYFIDNRIFDVSYYSANRVNTLSLHPDVYEDLRRYSIDPYVASRQAYYEYRKQLIDHE